MTTPTPTSRRVRANGDGTVYQRKDGRWEAASYVLAPAGTRKRVRIYGVTRAEALAKLTEKIAASNRGVPVVTAQGSLTAFLTYWLENVAVHQLRETTHTRYTAVVEQYLIPGLGRKKLAKLTAKDVRTWLNELRTACQCCARGIDAGRNPNAQASRRPRCCAIGRCCPKRLSPLTLAYIHSVLKSALEHAVREEENPAQRRPKRPHRNTPPPPLQPPHHRRGRAVPRGSPGAPARRAVRARPAHRPTQGQTPRPALGRPRPQHRPPSADVAVNYCRQAPQEPHRNTSGEAPARQVHYLPRAIPEGSLPLLSTLCRAIHM